MILRSLVALVVVLCAWSGIANAGPSDADVRAIAKEAYIYSFAPVLHIVTKMLHSWVY